MRQSISYINTPPVISYKNVTIAITFLPFTVDIQIFHASPPSSDDCHLLESVINPVQNWYKANH